MRRVKKPLECGAPGHHRSTLWPCSTGQVCVSGLPGCVRTLPWHGLSGLASVRSAGSTRARIAGHLSATYCSRWPRSLSLKCSDNRHEFYGDRSFLFYDPRGCYPVSRCKAGPPGPAFETILLIATRYSRSSAPSRFSKARSTCVSARRGIVEVLGFGLTTNVRVTPLR